MMAFGSFLGLAAPTVHAQAAPATQAVQDGVQTVTVVRARKHTEMARAVPITMDILGGQAIKDSGIVRVEDLQANVSGRVIDSYETQGQISLRGMGMGSGEGPLSLSRVAPARPPQAHLLSLAASIFCWRSRPPKSSRGLSALPVLINRPSSGNPPR